MKITYTRLRAAVFTCLCGILIYGCNLINPKEPVPTYFHIDSVHLVANPFLINAPKTSQITNIFVYYNNNPIGAYDLPATFPVVTNGSDSGKLQISAGIRINGLSNILGQYAFYQLATTTFAPQPGKVINYMPTTSFYTNCKVTTISDFEGAVNFSLADGNIPMVKVTDPSVVFAGYGTGSITLNAIGDSSIDSSTTTTFAIPVGQPVFIEFDYKSDVPFYVGLQANLSPKYSSMPYYTAGIGPSDHWQKFYYNASDFANQAQGNTYTLYFKAVLGSGQTSGRLLIDNIQLITF